MWMFAGGSAQAVLKILILMILSRLLAPAEFGLVAAALTVVALAEVFGKIGVAPSIVQMEILTEDHVRTGTSVTMISGVLVGLIVYFLAEPLGQLYAIDELPAIIRVFSFIFLFRAAGLVSEALIQRQLEFRKLALVLVFSYLIGYAGVAVVLAWQGAGAWALVAGQMAQAALQSALLIHLAKYRIKPGYDGPKLRQMLHFGFGATLTQIGNYVALNIDYLIVGRVLGAAPLGLYSRAYLLLSQPANIVGNTADKVLFPVLSGVQTDRPRVERAYNTTIGLTAITQIPLSVLLCIYAEQVIGILMGPQWDAAIAPFQIMVCALFFRTAYKFTGTILRAIGKVYHAAALQWAYGLFVAIGAGVGVQFGLQGVAVGTSLAVAFCYFNGLILLHRVFEMSARNGIIAIFRHAGLAFLFAGPLIGVHHLTAQYLKWADLPVFISGCITLTVSFALVAAILPSALGEERLPLFSLLNKIRRKV